MTKQEKCRVGGKSLLFLLSALKISQELRWSKSGLER
jgi:hypothetical protein